MSSGNNLVSRKQRFVSLLNTAARLSGAGFSFLMLIFLTRNMTPADFADFTLVLAWLAIANTLTAYSMPLLLVRVVAENLATGNSGLARGGWHFALGVTSTFSLLVAVLFFLASTMGLLGIPGRLEEAALVIGLLIPVNTMILVISGLMQGLKQVVAAELLINTSRPILLMLTASLLWQLGSESLRTIQVLELYLGVTLTLGLACLMYLRLYCPPEIWQKKPRILAGPWFRIASGYMIVAMATALNERIDILVMGHLASPEEIAYYAVAARFAQTLMMLGIAVCAVVTPHVAENLTDLRSGHCSDAFRELVRQNSLTILLLMGAAWAVLILLGPFILALFGPQYQAAYAPMIILAGGLCIAALFGPSVSFAAFIGETRIAMFSLVVGLLSNFLLSLLLTPSFGALGASMAMVTGMVTSTIAANKLLKSRCNLDTRALNPGRNFSG